MSCVLIHEMASTVIEAYMFEPESDTEAVKIETIHFNEEIFACLIFGKF